MARGNVSKHKPPEMEEGEKKESVEKAHDDDDEIIWVTEFDDDKAKDFSEKLFRISAKDTKKPIMIYIDSYGGSVDALASMYAALDVVPNQIITICMGKPLSAGAMLLSYGDVRYVVPHGRIMIHEVSAGAWGNINDLKTTASEMARMNEYWMTMLAVNCGKSLKKLLKCFTNRKRDLYMTPEQALAFGIVDKIGMPRLKKVVRYEVE
jgi:ATP-dependent Clp protease protease subunit